MSISSTEILLLEYVRRAVGAGKITNKVRARAFHSPSYAYTLSNRAALALLKQVAPYLQTYKKQRARLLLEQYLSLTPRNGKYSVQLLAQRAQFESDFFAVSIRAKEPADRNDSAAA